jgi:phage FluMu protein Com
MMRDPRSLRCANCGTVLDLPTGGELAGVTCPVCQFFNRFSTTVVESALTCETLEGRLSELITHGRASGIPLDEIVRILRDELEFTAELAHSGRDLCVQIIDLGPRVGEPIRRTRYNESLLRGRALDN